MFLRQALGLDLNADADATVRWFFSDQNSDGSWGIAPGHPGDVSTSTEAYLALRILNVPTTHPAMLRARQYILSVGGVAKVRVFTRIYMAMFGLFPWSAVPQLPAELILMPPSAPINIYKFSSWARSTIVPLLILNHHQPIFALPNGKMADNDFVDEIWCNPTDKLVAYVGSLSEIWSSDSIALIFAVIDKILIRLGGLRHFFLRAYSRRKCLNWILNHQEESGDWAGIFPPMHLGILALVLEGHTLTDSPVRRGLEAVERFVWQDHKGKRVQACVSPIWDTVLSVIGLCDAGVSGKDKQLIRAMEWVKARQQLGPEGDWRIYRPDITPGGWAFEYHNSWYPDVDDTAAVLLAFLKQSPESRQAPVIINATEWVLGMQNLNGGFAAFDWSNDKVWLNKIPFSDMNSLSDPSTADVTGRVLEAFGLLLESPHLIPADLSNRVRSASAHAIAYLSSEQEASGSWYGRWGSNYVYGTSNVLCGLEYFSSSSSSNDYKYSDLLVQTLVNPAIRWLRTKQNADGGWGEDLMSYKDPQRAGCGPSTASQTAWGLMALLAHLPPTDEAIRKGIAYLILTQSVRKGEGAASWPEPAYTGTGFPGFFYLGYTLYAHYFPLMALGRFVRSCASYSHEKSGSVILTHPPNTKRRNRRNRQLQINLPFSQQQLLEEEKKITRLSTSTSTSSERGDHHHLQGLFSRGWGRGWIAGLGFLLLPLSFSLVCGFWQFVYGAAGSYGDASLVIVVLVYFISFFTRGVFLEI